MHRSQQYEIHVAPLRNATRMAASWHPVGKAVTITWAFPIATDPLQVLLRQKEINRHQLIKRLLVLSIWETNVAESGA